jgi:glycosyltransferase involved in cell wall biosynthesis
VIAIQHDHQRALISPRFQNRLALVPNLIRSFSERPRSFEAATFDAIWVAQVRPEKQFELFLDLAAALPDLRFAVVGGLYLSADLRASLEARLDRLNNLTFLGPQPAEKVMTLLAQSKVLVNTSRYEGFPITMLEAWSVGVPVVSLSVDPGGVIKREQLGFVSGTNAQLRRDVSALALTEPLNRRLGSNGLAYVRREHSLDAVCKALSHALPGLQLAPTSAELAKARP